MGRVRGKQDRRMSMELDGEAWMAVLSDLSDALGPDGAPVKLCLIGSAACLFGGMAGRTSRDLDVWRPASDFDRRELQSAAGKVGLMFDPRQSLEPARPYLQLVEPGMTQLGAFEPILVERMGRLLVFRPPVETSSRRSSCGHLPRILVTSSFCGHATVLPWRGLGPSWLAFQSLHGASPWKTSLTSRSSVPCHECA